MGLLDKNMADIQERTSVPNGQYGITLKGASISVGKESGRGMINFYWTVDDHPGAKMFTERIFVVKNDDDENFVANNDQAAKGFTDACGVDYDDFLQKYEQAEAAETDGLEEKIKITDWNGVQCQAVLKNETGLDGDLENKIVRFITK